MVPLSILAGLGALAAVAAGPATAAPAGAAPDPLAAHRWTSRVLAVMAPDAADPRLATQRRLYNDMRGGARERDLVLVEGVGASPEAQALRARFGTAPSGFRAVLVGKDGGEKLSSAEPIGPDVLFPLIDSMPMRRQEMRKAEP